MYGFQLFSGWKKCCETYGLWKETGYLYIFKWELSLVKGPHMKLDPEGRDFEQQAYQQIKDSVGSHFFSHQTEYLPVEAKGMFSMNKTQW